MYIHESNPPSFNTSKVSLHRRAVDQGGGSRLSINNNDNDNTIMLPSRITIIHTRQILFTKLLKYMTSRLPIAQDLIYGCGKELRTFIWGIDSPMGDIRRTLVQYRQYSRRRGAQTAFRRCRARGTDGGLQDGHQAHCDTNTMCKISGLIYNDSL